MADDVQDLIQSNADLKKKVELMRQQSINRARTLQAQLLKANAPADSSQQGAQGSSDPAQGSSLPSSTPTSKAKSKRIVFAMSKLSLFSIVLSLMLFGAFVFAGGFLTGYWISGGAQNFRQPAFSLPQGIATNAQSALAQGLNDINFQNIAGQQAAYATQNSLSDQPIPGVPDALQPLASSVQFAASNAIANKVGRNVAQSVGHQLQATSQRKRATSSTPTTPSSTQTTPQGQSYTVQLGIFATQENAQAMMQHLQSQNYTTADIVPVKQPSGETLYAVYSGKYPSYEIASAVAAQFAQQNIPGAMVTSLQSQGDKK